MHTPKTFEEKNPDTLLKIMRDNAFATIITTDENGKPIATQLPFLVKQSDNKIKLEAHFAKVNPQWKQLENNAQVLVVFQGPHCYISPSWYDEAGVPTWDYVTVQTYGSAKLFETKQQTAELIEELTDKYEQVFDKTVTKRWKAKNNYPDTMLNTIVVLRLPCILSKERLKSGKINLGRI